MLPFGRDARGNYVEEGPQFYFVFGASWPRGTATLPIIAGMSLRWKLTIPNRSEYEVRLYVLRNSEELAGGGKEGFHSSEFDLVTHQSFKLTSTFCPNNSRRSGLRGIKTCASLPLLQYLF